MQDEAWKEIIEKMFSEFLAFFFPSIYYDIDFSRKPEFLDKELQRILKKSEIGKRIADKLVKVYLNDNTERWLLIHIEVQGHYEKDFVKRMFSYFYRIYEKYGEEVISLVIFADDSRSFHPDTFCISRWGFTLHFQFPYVKLIDYASKQDELKKNTNPFAIVVQSFLKTIETRGNEQARYSWKKNFLIGLYERGLTHDQIFSLYKFIDLIMNLSDELDKKLIEEIENIEKEKKMAIVTSAERIGIKRGKIEGRAEGELLGEIKAILAIKFEKNLYSIYPQMKKIDNIEILQNMIAGVKNAKNFDEANDSILLQISKWQTTQI